MDRSQADLSDDAILWRLARGDDHAFGLLMERWGDPVIDTCFRALGDAIGACDLYAEVWAEVYVRVRLGTERRPGALGPWLVEIIGGIIDRAASDGTIPSTARQRMRLAPGSPSSAELAEIDRLQDETMLRAARNALPREFSAAADLMLLRMPGPTALDKVRAAARGAQ